MGFAPSLDFAAIRLIQMLGRNIAPIPKHHAKNALVACLFVMKVSWLRVLANSVDLLGQNLVARQDAAFGNAGTGAESDLFSA